MLWGHRLCFQGFISLISVSVLALFYHYLLDLPVISYHPRFLTHKIFFLHRVTATSAIFCFLIPELHVREVFAAFYVHFDVGWSLISSHPHTVTLILFFLPRLSFSPLDAFRASVVFPLYIVVRALFFNLQLPILVLGASRPFSVSLLKLAVITSFFLLDDP